MTSFVSSILRNGIFNRNSWRNFKGGKTRRYYEVVEPRKISKIRKVPSTISKPEYWVNGLPAPPPLTPEIKSCHQIERMRRTCRLASSILYSLQDFIDEGITTDDLDEFVHMECLKHGAYPSPLNYKGFPKSICTSVNNVACHGIPDNRPLIEGDILNIDITVYREGCHGDCSAMFCIGKVDSKGKELCEVCLEALEGAIAICHPGVPFAEIGRLTEQIVESKGFVVIPSFAGHGIGSYFHGPPDIYHIDSDYPGLMKEGMTFTIEPLIGEGSRDIIILEDNWTAVTEDDSRTAQWEHTVLITSTGVEVLTMNPFKTD